MKRMKRIILAVTLVLGLAGGLYAANETYTLRPVTSSADTVLCGEDGGKAALIAEINERGTPTTSFEPFCLLPVK